MKVIKTFETWNNNIIDDSLFSSGKAKYHPEVSAGKISYKTGNVEPYFFAEIEKKGDKFICKVYRKKKDGSEKRIRNKVKKTLKLAHNYVREFLNQKLKRKAKGKDKETDLDRVIREEPRENIENTSFGESPYMEPPKSKTIIRRF